MLCTTCAYDNDRSHCEVPSFEDVVDCTVYVPKERDKSYIIPYNFPLNTRRGFKTIYYLMRLSQHDMTTVIIDIIKVRQKSINVILNACDKIEKENDKIIKALYGEAE
jgi:hypothetical protein